MKSIEEKVKDKIDAIKIPPLRNNKVEQRIKERLFWNKQEMSCSTDEYIEDVEYLLNLIYKQQQELSGIVISMNTSHALEMMRML